jgi:hypothetical protein
MRSTSPPEDGPHPRREVSVANTDLLFSLFRGIEEEQPKMTVVRRGRYGLSVWSGECVLCLLPKLQQKFSFLQIRRVPRPRAISVPPGAFMRYMLLYILGVFAKLRKPTVSFVMFVCPSFRMKLLGSHWTDFHDIWCLGIFLWKSIEKIQISLKSDKNNR